MAIQTPSPRFSPKFVKKQPHFAGFTLGKVVGWAPTLAMWGAGAAVGGALYLSQIPLFQQDGQSSSLSLRLPLIQ